MKILFLHRWVGVHEGGTETHVKNLMRFLAGKGHQVFLITRQGKTLTDLDPRIKVYRIPRLPFESDFSYKSMYDPRLYFYTAVFSLLIFLKIIEIYLFQRKKPDIISVHFVTEALAARLIRLIFQVPYSFSLEGYTRLEAKEAKKANLSFACSADIVEKCKKNFGYQPILKLHGVDFSIFNREKDTRALRNKLGLENNFVFLTVCRLEPRKNLPTLLRAARNLTSSHELVRFIVVGEGVQGEELKTESAEMGLTGKVIFTGRVRDQELPLYYALADAFVLPTLYEGFGIVYAEAMAAHLPIISTTAGAVPEVVGPAGILVEPRDIRALTAVLERLYLDKALYRQLSEASYHRGTTNFNSEMFLHIFEDSLINYLK